MCASAHNNCLPARPFCGISLVLGLLVRFDLEVHVEQRVHHAFEVLHQVVEALEPVGVLAVFNVCQATDLCSGERNMPVHNAQTKMESTNQSKRKRM